MTTYVVQFTYPVDNPTNKVRLTKDKGVMHFEVPLNHPEAHSMGFMDLCAAAELSGLLGLPTALITNKKEEERASIIRKNSVSK